MEMKERNNSVVELRKQGITLRKIGQLYDLSPERVRQICCKDEWRREAKIRQRIPDYRAHGVLKSILGASYTKAQAASISREYFLATPNCGHKTVELITNWCGGLKKDVKFLVTKIGYLQQLNKALSLDVKREQKKAKEGEAWLEQYTGTIKDLRRHGMGFVVLATGETALEIDYERFAKSVGAIQAKEFADVIHEVFQNVEALRA